MKKNTKIVAGIIIFVLALSYIYALVEKPVLILIQPMGKIRQKEFVIEEATRFLQFYFADKVYVLKDLPNIRSSFVEDIIAYLELKVKTKSTLVAIVDKKTSFKESAHCYKGLYGGCSLDGKYVVMSLGAFDKMTTDNIQNSVYHMMYHSCGYERHCTVCSCILSEDLNCSKSSLCDTCSNKLQKSYSKQKE